MIVDAHTHFQPHGQQPPVDRARLELYVEQAQRNGVDIVVFTEHLFRFHEAVDLLDGWLNSDPNPALVATAHAYVADHVNLAISDYVHLIEDAKADGLPVRLGLELDWIPGHADDLRRLLAPYDWDCILGSVHWLGAFGIDVDDYLAEWARRDVAAVWDEYAQFVEDLADARLVDVLAHPDVIKVWGIRPPDESDVQRRIVAAAARNGTALEINTNGYNKPVAELYPDARILRQAHQAGVRITLGSDAHSPDRLGERFADAAAAARAAGYDEYVAFEQRRASMQKLP